MEKPLKRDNNKPHIKPLQFGKFIARYNSRKAYTYVNDLEKVTIGLIFDQAQALVLTFLCGHYYLLERKGISLSEFVRQVNNTGFNINQTWFERFNNGKYKACNIVKLVAICRYWKKDIAYIYTVGLRELRKGWKPKYKMISFPF